MLVLKSLWHTISYHNQQIIRCHAKIEHEGGGGGNYDVNIDHGRPSMVYKKNGHNTLNNYLVQLNFV